ncbi:hypothetical protein F5Y12DRAFT_768317 [Xylaria sp. FL1777]|nr:hypothetical protein F5Y12DRAFT_768317 [Xylaria sp. FL1777]
MADIVSIIFSAISATQKSSIAIYKFTRGCKEARSDLTKITQELSELALILELIRDSNDAAPETLPEALQVQVKAMLESCVNLVGDIEKVIVSCSGRAGVLRWTLVEKENVKAIKTSLEATKSGLSLALDAANLSLAKDIKNNTDAIQGDTAELKRDTEEILEGIRRLRLQLPRHGSLDEERIRLEAWLDSLTQYAETIADDGTVNEAGASSFVGEGDRESNVNDHSELPTALTHAITSRTNHVTQSAEQETPTPEEESPIRSHPTPSAIPRTPEYGSKGSRGKPISGLLASLPDVWAEDVDVNVECQICVTIDKESVVKIWSLETKKVIKEFTSRHRKVSPRTVSICPANPQIIILQSTSLESNQVNGLTIEAWNWGEDRQIDIIFDDISFGSNHHHYHFVPSSPKIYSRTGTKGLIIIDLDVPSGTISRAYVISLSLLPTLAEDKAYQRGVLQRVHFTSDCEAVLVWRRRLSGALSLLLVALGAPELFVEVALLSSVDSNDGQKLFASQRYSDTVIQHARIIAKLWLPREVHVIRNVVVSQEYRVALILAEHKSQKPLYEGHVIYCMSLDNGGKMSVYHIPKGWIFGGLWGSCIELTYGEGGAHMMISVTDRRELGILKNLGRVVWESSDAFFSVRSMEPEVDIWEIQKPWALQDA